MSLLIIATLSCLLHNVVSLFFFLISSFSFLYSRYLSSFPILSCVFFLPSLLSSFFSSSYFAGLFYAFHYLLYAKISLLHHFLLPGSPFFSFFFLDFPPPLPLPPCNCSSLPSLPCYFGRTHNLPKRCHGPCSSCDSVASSLTCRKHKADTRATGK